MHRADAVFLAVALAAVAFSAAYAVDPPAPLYYPLENVWRMERIPGSPAMAWYGRLAWGFGAAVTVWAVTLAALRRPSRGAGFRLSPRAAGFLTAAPLVALVALMAAIVCHEFSAWGVWDVLRGQAP